MATDVNWTSSDKWRSINLDEITFEGVGPYDMPVIQPEQYIHTEFIGFNYAKGCKDRSNYGVHFFLDDYQFERVWSQLKRYTEMLSQFQAILSPSFSLYTDWPKAVQIWNMYRRHYVAAYMQLYGVKVYPTIMWSDTDSFKWCFDGEPVHSCVAVESLGTQKHDFSKKMGFKRPDYDAKTQFERLYGKDVPAWSFMGLLKLLPKHIEKDGVKYILRISWIDDDDTLYYVNSQHKTLRFERGVSPDSKDLLDSLVIMLTWLIKWNYITPYKK